MPTVSIIGTSHSDKFNKNSKGIFNAMVKKAYNIITDEIKELKTNITLVSGGAAWSDHVAVSLFDIGVFKGCILYLPCSLVKINGQFSFKDTGQYAWQVNPGKTSNFYHAKFNLLTGIDSINQIGTFDEKFNDFAIDDSYFGFHRRNDEVAKSDYIIAFTFSDGDAPNDGGTLYTWNKFKGPKENRFHVSIHKLQIDT